MTISFALTVSVVVNDNNDRKLLVHVCGCKLTTEGSVCSCLQVHFGVAPLAHFSGVVADVVAAILTAAEADALLEAIGAGALVSKAHVVLVHQRVYKQVYRTLVLTLQYIHEICRETKARQLHSL